MFSHVTVGSRDLDKAKVFYDAILSQLGLKQRLVSPAGGYQLHAGLIQPVRCQGSIYTCRLMEIQQQQETAAWSHSWLRQKRRLMQHLSQVLLPMAPTKARRCLVHTTVPDTMRPISEIQMAIKFRLPVVGILYNFFVHLIASIALHKLGLGGSVKILLTK